MLSSIFRNIIPCRARAVLATYFMIVSCLAYSSVTCSSETPVDFYITEGETLAGSYFHHRHGADLAERKGTLLLERCLLGV
jgi:hypothetical protein